MHCTTRDVFFWRTRTLPWPTINNYVGFDCAAFYAFDCALFVSITHHFTVYTLNISHCECVVLVFRRRISRQQILYELHWLTNFFIFFHRHVIFCSVESTWFWPESKHFTTWFQGRWIAYCCFTSQSDIILSLNFRRRREKKHAPCHVQNTKRWNSSHFEHMFIHQFYPLDILNSRRKFS